MKRPNRTTQFVLAMLLVLSVFGGNSVSAAPATQAENTAYDLMLVVDGSSSITSADFQLAKSFVRRIVRSCIFGTDAYAGVVQFSSQGLVRREIGLSGDADAIVAAVDAARQLGGSTDIQEGLQVAQAELASNGRATAQPIIILLTDGAHNEPGDPVAEAENAKASGTRIFTVGVGSAVDSRQLRAIASDPDSENVFSVRDFDGLEAVLGRLVRNACSVDVIIDDSDETERPAKSPFVTIAQHPDPNITVQPGSIVTHTIVVTNRGEGGADGVTVTMPFTPTVVQVLDAAFSQPEAWVSAVLTDTLTFETGRIMENGGVLTATVRLAVQPGASIGTPLYERLVLNGTGVKVGYEYSNQRMLRVDTQNISQPHYPLLHAVADDEAGRMHMFNSDLFAPGEPVTFWYHTPEGVDVEIKMVTADDKGTVILAVPVAELPVGSIVVAYGNWSTITAMSTATTE